MILDLDLLFVQEDKGSAEVAYVKVTSESLSSIAVTFFSGEVAFALQAL